MEANVATYLFTQGVLGVACIVLGIVCFKLYNDNKALNAGRLQDSKDTTKDVTTVIQANTTSINLLTAKIEAGKQGSSA